MVNTTYYRSFGSSVNILLACRQYKLQHLSFTFSTSSQVDVSHRRKLKRPWCVISWSHLWNGTCQLRLNAIIQNTSRIVCKITSYNYTFIAKYKLIACMYSLMYACMFSLTHICTHPCMHTHNKEGVCGIPTYVYIPTHVWAFVHTYMHSCNWPLFCNFTHMHSNKNNTLSWTRMVRECVNCYVYYSKGKTKCTKLKIQHLILSLLINDSTYFQLLFFGIHLPFI